MEVLMKNKAVFNKIIITLCSVASFFISVNSHIMANNDTYKTFEIVIPSFNNERWAEANLRSVCFQNYPEDKYHVTYINDASTDRTQEIVTGFIKQHHLEKKVTLINNTINKGQMENRYRAFHNLPSTTIIAECDGDDFYAHNNVLQELNALYQDPATWMLYTIKYKQVPQEKTITQKTFTAQEIAQNTLRNFWHVPTVSLRSYYAWLFKQIKLKDLLYNGRFYPVLTDPAYMLTMLEMAGEHNQFVDKVLYLYNTVNPISVRKKYDSDFRKKVYDDISGKKPYQRLNAPIQTTETAQSGPIELIICTSSSKALANLLDEAQEKLPGINKCQAFLEQPSDTSMQFQPKTQLPFTFNCTMFNSHQDTLKDILKNYLSQTSSHTIVLATKDTLAINQPINLTECIDTLTNTFAAIFYLHQLKEISLEETPHVQVKNTIWAGQFNYIQPYIGAGTLLCTPKTLLTKLQTMSAKTVVELNKDIDSWVIPPDDVCLFFKK
jgi:glycosyltransferase involved in cell wall biosynthesis